MKKRSKKWWALTERRRRHDKSVKRQKRANAPKFYKRCYFIKPWKARCRAILANAVADGCFNDMSFPTFKKDANYTYW